MEYMCNISIYIISIKHRISFYSENLNIQFSTNNLQGSNTTLFLAKIQIYHVTIGRVKYQCNL